MYQTHTTHTHTHIYIYIYIYMTCIYFLYLWLWWRQIECDLFMISGPPNCYIPAWQSLTAIQGLYSRRSKTSYRQISRSLKVARLDVVMVISLWNLTGISATLLYGSPFSLWGKLRRWTRHLDGMPQLAPHKSHQLSEWTCRIYEAEYLCSNKEISTPCRIL